MNPRKRAEAALLEKGLRFLRAGGNHDLYEDPETHEIIPLSRSSHFDESDLKMILRELRNLEKNRRQS